MTIVDRFWLFVRSSGLSLWVTRPAVAVVKVVTFAIEGPEEPVGKLATTEVSGGAIPLGSVANTANGAVNPVSDAG